MLIIYSSLPLGGIETFILRFARECNKQGKKLKILLLSKSEDSDPYLLEQVEKLSQVYFYKDVFNSNFFNSERFFLLDKINISVLNKIFEDLKLLHVTKAEHLLLAYRFLNLLNSNIPITVGVYHSQEYCWKNKWLPYYEKMHRKYLFEINSDCNLLCFSNSTKDYLIKCSGYQIRNAKSFRLGVIDSIKFNENYCKDFNKNIKICAVGRLVKFKTYNLWIIEVIKNLNSKGYNITLDIYGTGPLYNHMYEQINENITLKGELPYENFNEVVSNYDLFVGSGTAIIQAASLGVPAIIAIESIDEPLTYGFFYEFYEHEYHHRDLVFPKFPVINVIENFILSSEEAKQKLSNLHIESSKIFDMENCVNNFFDLENYSGSKLNEKKYNLLIYYITKILFHIYIKIFKIDIYYVSDK